MTWMIADDLAPMPDLAGSAVVNLPKKRALQTPAC